METVNREVIEKIKSTINIKTDKVIDKEVEEEVVVVAGIEAKGINIIYSHKIKLNQFNKGVEDVAEVEVEAATNNQYIIIIEIKVETIYKDKI
jgi:hypothetical protein